ncbi:4'-phosphopantetheinyl transferase superfamily protein [Allokutzneria multivorans]|uniref:4'-phosphopantetheinyl transferase superfamily protein n=1 Tax=Allokutzneria multivorans TaxID=1142134 RepID=A0ABP7SU61_9PSEU
MPKADVWWVELGSVPLEPMLAWLNDEERDRWSRYLKDDDKQRFLLGASLSRAIVARSLGVAAADVPLERHCSRCEGPHGPVTSPLPGAPKLSVTHAGELVGVAASMDGLVGLDVEPSSGRAPLKDLSVVFGPDEIAGITRAGGGSEPFLRMWTRKEAVVKAVGVGFMVSLPDVVLTGPASAPRLLSWPAEEPGADRYPAEMRMADVQAPRDHVGAVAVVAERAAGELVVAQHNGADLLTAAIPA